MNTMVVPEVAGANGRGVEGSATVFTAFVILTFSSVGAGYVESFVNYLA